MTSPNPLAAMMGPPAAEQPGPLAGMMGLGAPTPDPSLQAPAGIPGAPPSPEQQQGDELQKKILALQAQLDKNIAELHQDPKLEIEKAVGDFNSFNEKSYQQTYGGGGILGTAGRALANLLSGAAHGGQTIKQTLEAQNEKKWKDAIAAEAQRVQLQKSQLAQASALQAQELSSLRLEQQQRQQALLLAESQRKTDINSPDAKAAAEQERVKQTIQHLKDLNIWDKMTDEQKGAITAGAKTVTAEPFKPVPGTAKAEDILQAHPEATAGGQKLVFGKYYRQLKPGDYATFEPTAPPASEVVRTSESTHDTITGYDAQGRPIVEKLGSTRTSGPAGSVPPAAGSASYKSNISDPDAGPRVLHAIATKAPLTANQQVTLDKQVGALDNTIEIAKRIEKNIDLLQSTIVAKKIQLQIDAHQGIVKAVINRNVDLTPQELQLAQDLQSITEHINTLRGPLGATGFRGAEAWAALQGQAGNPMANPEVSKGVLASTIKALETQQKAINNKLHPGEGPKTADDFLKKYPAKK